MCSAHFSVICESFIPIILHLNLSCHQFQDRFSFRLDMFLIDLMLFTEICFILFTDSDLQGNRRLYKLKFDPFTALPWPRVSLSGVWHSEESRRSHLLSWHCKCRLLKIFALMGFKQNIFSVYFAYLFGIWKKTPSKNMHTTLHSVHESQGN